MDELILHTCDQIMDVASPILKQVAEGATNRVLDIDKCVWMNVRDVMSTCTKPKPSVHQAEWIGEAFRMT